MDDNFFGIWKVRFFFGWGFFKIKSNKRIVSVLNLVEIEKEIVEYLDLVGVFFWLKDL